MHVEREPKRETRRQFRCKFRRIMKRVTPVTFSYFFRAFLNPVMLRIYMHFGQYNAYRVQDTTYTVIIQHFQPPITIGQSKSRTLYNVASLALTDNAPTQLSSASSSHPGILQGPNLVSSASVSESKDPLHQTRAPSPSVHYPSLSSSQTQHLSPGCPSGHEVLALASALRVGQRAYEPLL